MNHTPHILASVFLCGLWLPIWVLIAATYDARFHCSQCGHSDGTSYLANPYLRQQKAQQSALRAQQVSSYVQSFTEWFSALSNRSKGIVIGLPVALILFFVMVGVLAPKVDKQNKPSNTSTNIVATSSPGSTATKSVYGTPEPSPATPSNLSAKENLDAGKKAFSDGNLSTARSHLSAIPKDAKEFASAKQHLATLERREKRNGVEGELAQVRRDLASVEDMLDATEDFGDQAGSPKKAIYMNALKRKAELQLRRIQLERKLKNMS